MLGGVGVLPSVASGDSGDGDTARDPAAGSVLAGAETSPSAQASVEPPVDSSGQSPSPGGGAGGSKPQDKPQGKPANVTSSDASLADDATSETADANPPVPEDSGEGRRIVFDQSDQRVWLVDDDEHVERTYLVSGSLHDNLDPGTYSVYSRSEHAWGVDDSGTMEYFVRFTEGPNGGAIGFHDIPIDDGELVQTVAQLGTPQSHGCVRQERDDAIALWEFAPIGTEVDVTA
jgi:hypothetical protein